jgi:hypothetical protein
MKHLKKFNENSSTPKVTSLSELYSQIRERFSDILSDEDYNDMINYKSELNEITVNYKGEDHDFNISITLEGGQYLVRSY